VWVEKMYAHSGEGARKNEKIIEKKKKKTKKNVGGIPTVHYQQP